MIESLQRWAAERGYQVAWGGVEIVREVQAEIRQRHATQQLDDHLFQSVLSIIASEANRLNGASVVVVGKPRPAHLVSFDLGGKHQEAILPPTYFRFRSTFEGVRQDLASHGLPGARVDLITAPLKAVAARLGLVRYGRNNIAYAPKIGSYLQLCGYVTDQHLPATGTGSDAPQLLPECADCTICRAACPTGAIADDRIQLRAERCLTLANENSGVWPDWVPRRSHHCLLGCLLCQRACPANPELPISTTAVNFSRDETAILLSGSSVDWSGKSGIRAKLAWLGQSDAESVLGRNLRALIDRSGIGAAGSY